MSSRCSVVLLLASLHLGKNVQNPHPASPNAWWVGGIRNVGNYDQIWHDSLSVPIVIHTKISMCATRVTVLDVMLHVMVEFSHSYILLAWNKSHLKHKNVNYVHIRHLKFANSEFIAKKTVNSQWQTVTTWSPLRKLTTHARKICVWMCVCSCT